MNSSTFRVKVLEEVQLIPEGKLEEVYDFIHYFKLGIETHKEQPQQIMKFAGCWKDIPEKTFAKFSKEIFTRRRQAFSRRRSHETHTD